MRTFKFVKVTASQLNSLTVKLETITIEALTLSKAWIEIKKDNLPEDDEESEQLFPGIHWNSNKDTVTLIYALPNTLEWHLLAYETNS